MRPELQCCVLFYPHCHALMFTPDVDQMPRALSAAKILRPSSLACSTSRTLASSLSLPLCLRTAVSSRRLLRVLALAAAFWCFVHAACSTIPSFLTSSTNCLTSGSDSAERLPSVKDCLYLTFLWLSPEE